MQWKAISFILWICMKSKKIIIKILVGVSVVGFIAFLVVMQNRNSMIAENKVDFLKKNGKITIGTITGKNYHSTKNLSQLKTIMYEYQVDNSKFTESIGSYIPKACSIEARQIWATDNTNAKEGFRFIVIYEADDPSNSILCLDYPVTSEADLDIYNSKLKRQK